LRTRCGALVTVAAVILRAVVHRRCYRWKRFFFCGCDIVGCGFRLNGGGEYSGAKFGSHGGMVIFEHHP
jgi:hypothetical protein